MASLYVKYVNSQAEMDTLLNEHTSIVVGFHAAWSAPCRGMAPFYARLATKHRSMTFVQVEIDTNNIQSIAQKCRLIALPTFIIIKNEGEIDRIRGADREGLEHMIIKHAPDAQPTDKGTGSAVEIAAGDESLLEYLDMHKVNCLNEAQEHPLKSIVEKKAQNTTEAYLESDADEQLLITLPFNREVKVRSVILYTKDSKFGPKRIKVDINKPALGFDDVESASEPAVIQVLEVSEDTVKKGEPIHLRFVRLQRVNSLQIFVESNHGDEDVTRIDAIDVYGPSYGKPVATTQMTGLRNFLAIHRRGVQLLDLVESGGDHQNLSKAIALIRESVLLCPAGHSRREMLVGDLAIALSSQYRHQGDYADLSEAITLFYEVLNPWPSRHPKRTVTLSNLASALLLRYEREGSVSDLENSIEMQREALILRPPGHPDRAIILNNLVNALREQYGREESLSDLAEIIELQREALSLRPPGHPDRAGYFHNLADALLIRYEREGNLSDLEDTIEMQRETLSLCPPGHPLRTSPLHTLASALLARYKREGSLSDLEEAIEMQRELLSLHPLGNPYRAATLSNLATVVLTRYNRTKSVSDLKETIEMQQEALNLCPPGDPNLPSYLNNLAGTLRFRYEREGSVSDLDQAIEMQREVLNLYLPGHSDRAAILSNLANSLAIRYEHEESLLGLKEAIEQQTKALDLQPYGHPERSQSLLSLSRTYLLAFDRKDGAFTMHDRQALVDKVFTMLREAVDHPNSPPLHRLTAALHWIDASHSLARGSVLDAYNAALDQLDIVLATSSTLKGKHTQLSSQELARCKQLGVEAASCAVRQGDMILAVEFFERGRNLLFAQIGRYRVELEELQKENAELAERFSNLSNLLDSSVVSNQPTLEGRTAFEDSTGRYRRVASDWDRAVNDIRAVPGFENFLRPRRYATLKAAAAEGPVVIVIPDDDRSHALIILHDHDTPHYVDLPAAGRDELVELCSELVRAVRSDDEDDANNRITTLLRSLWVRVVAPIADTLSNELRYPISSRIWWCPSSFLSMLPLHAAGRYASNADPNQNFPDKYVSSYTPTLWSLLQARSKRNFSEGENMLIVAQPDTPHHDPLPSALPEASVVKTLAEAKMKMKVTLLFSKEGTRASVFDSIINHPWIHLICHGSQNSFDPFNSCFRLYDGPLTLRNIMQRGLPDAQFAFLAACHTATGDVKLLDEGLHLAAGLQFAGFKSVVGTIWEVADIDGPMIAEAFYNSLQGDRLADEGVDCSRAAYSLSTAVKYLRDSGVPISRWIRHIHIGV